MDMPTGIAQPKGAQGKEPVALILGGAVTARWRTFVIAVEKTGRFTIGLELPDGTRHSVTPVPQYAGNTSKLDREHAPKQQVEFTFDLPPKTAKQVGLPEQVLAAINFGEEDQQYMGALFDAA